MMFKLGVTVAVLLGLVTAQTVTYQAESAALSGTEVGTSVTGYTGMLSKTIMRRVVGFSLIDI